LLQKLDNRLIINIKDSLFLTLIFMAIHLGGIVLVGLVPLAWPVRFGLWGIIVFSLYRCVRVHGRRRTAPAIVAVEFDAEDACAVQIAGETAWRPCHIVSRFVHPWLVLASLRLDGHHWPVGLVITVDAVAPAVFRRLRVRLKRQSAGA